MDQEREDYADPEHPGRQVRPNTVWRPAATAAIVCVVLIPLLAVLCRAIADADPRHASWTPAIVAIGSTFAAGIGFAIAGVRRGSRVSRAASAICLVVLALPVLAVAIICGRLIAYGMPRLG
jgi:hypothetical protein